MYVIVCYKLQTMKKRWVLLQVVYEHCDVSFNLKHAVNALSLSVSLSLTHIQFIWILTHYDSFHTLHVTFSQANYVESCKHIKIQKQNIQYKVLHVLDTERSNGHKIHYIQLISWLWLIFEHTKFHQNKCSASVLM